MPATSHRSRSQAAYAVLCVAVLFAACAAPAPPGPNKPAPAAAGPAAGGPGAALGPTTQAAEPVAPAPPSVAHLRMGYQRLAVDLGVYVADARGYSAQEGIEIELINFGSGSEMMPALATGQLEISGAAANPATLNAIARGVPLKAMLDRGSFRPGMGEQAIVVRKEVYERGRGHRLEDLPELTLGLVPPGKGTTSACALAAGLQRVGLTLDDLNIQTLPFVDMVAALANGAIDAAMISEPFMTRAQRQGSIVRLMGVDELYPNFTLTILGFHRDLYDDRPLAKRFVRAYLRAIREFLDAHAGRTSEADRAQIDEIIARYTGLDAATVREMQHPGFNPNGLPNKEATYYCYQFFRDLGLMPQPIPDATFAALWGTDVVEEVLAEIGRRPEE